MLCKASLEKSWRLPSEKQPIPFLGFFGEGETGWGEYINIVLYLLFN